MFERFTDQARQVLVLAQEEARVLNHGYVGAEHILLGLIREGEGVAAKALESLGISLQAVRQQVEEVIGLEQQVEEVIGPQQQVEEIIGLEQQAAFGHIPFTSFTPGGKKALELSLREALQLGHHYIGTEHILLASMIQGVGEVGC
jgi:ATP-dependent Clp protease ATP-binding subunit ClpC